MARKDFGAGVMGESGGMSYEEYQSSDTLAALQAAMAPPEEPQGFFQQAWSGITNAVSAVTEKATDIYQNVVDKGTQVVNNVVAAGSALLQQGVDLVNEYVPFVSEFFPSGEDDDDIFDSFQLDLALPRKLLSRLDISSNVWRI